MSEFKKYAEFKTRVLLIFAILLGFSLGVLYGERTTKELIISMTGQHTTQILELRNQCVNDISALNKSHRNSIARMQTKIINSGGDKS